MIARSVLGVLIPTMIFLYGLRSAMNRQTLVPSRGGLAQIIGLPAVAAGFAYAVVGVILYVYVCWDDHPRFAGVRDAVLQLLLIAVAIALAATFGLVLIYLSLALILIVVKVVVRHKRRTIGGAVG